MKLYQYTIQSGSQQIETTVLEAEEKEHEYCIPEGSISQNIPKCVIGTVIVGYDKYTVILDQNSPEEAMRSFIRFWENTIVQKKPVCGLAA